MVSDTDAVWVSAPLVAVIVAGYVPAAVTLAIVSVNVDEPLPLTVAGLKDAATPAGKPLAVSVTAPVNPFNAFTLTVYVALPPDTADCVDGVAATPKSGAGALPPPTSVAACSVTFPEAPTSSVNVTVSV